MRLQLRSNLANYIQPGNLEFDSNVFSLARTSRCFSTSGIRHTRQRRSMWMWLETQGRNFIEPLPGSTNYLGAYDIHGRLKRLDTRRDDGLDNSFSDSTSTSISGGEEQIPQERLSDLTPFPLNRTFRSQSVVNEKRREAIWEKVMKEGQSVSAVSSEFGVEMSRVGAIVRLKEVEKEWILQGKRLAKPYARAVMEMLPKTPFNAISRMPQAHESINDLPVHAATIQQIFHPASESREFTRVDAAKVFDEKLLPADQRVPHPELAELERDRLSGMPFKDRMAKATKRNAEALQRRLVAEQRRKERDEEGLKLVSGARWDFKFREVSVDDAGIDGRGQRGTGWRYGVPHMDRRKGEVKIATRVA